MFTAIQIVVSVVGKPLVKHDVHFFRTCSLKSKEDRQTVSFLCNAFVTACEVLPNSSVINHTSRKHISRPWFTDSTCWAIVLVINVHNVLLISAKMYDKRYAGTCEGVVLLFLQHEVMVPCQTFVDDVNGEPGVGNRAEVHAVLHFRPAQIVETFCDPLGLPKILL